MSQAPPRGVNSKKGALGTHKSPPGPPDRPRGTPFSKENLPQRRGVGRTPGTPGGPENPKAIVHGYGLQELLSRPRRQQLGATPASYLSEAHHNIPASVSTFGPRETSQASCLLPSGGRDMCECVQGGPPQGWQAALPHGSKACRKKALRARPAALDRSGSSESCFPPKYATGSSSPDSAPHYPQARLSPLKAPAGPRAGRGLPLPKTQPCPAQASGRCTVSQHLLPPVGE